MITLNIIIRAQKMMELHDFIGLINLLLSNLEIIFMTNLKGIF
jgi:hypothetical protein